jgi:hypothetical protein
MNKVDGAEMTPGIDTVNLSNAELITSPKRNVAALTDSAAKKNVSLSYLDRLKKKDPLIRKSFSLLKQVPRFGATFLRSGRNPYCLLANSFPKSGTHLLTQILEAFPGVKNYDSFIASIPPIRFQERSQATLLQRIRWIAPGELVSAHLHYSQACQQALRMKGCVHYLIIRDPRDVVVSEAYYLTFMNKYHRLHHYFAHALSSLSERISCAIDGIPQDRVPYRYPDLSQRFMPYLEWFAQKDVCVVKYEDLITEARDESLRQMLVFHDAIADTPTDHSEILAGIARNLVPEKSRTFRQGGTGGWKDVFTPHHKKRMKEIAGELLIRLGYEDDWDW